MGQFECLELVREQLAGLVPAEDWTVRTAIHASFLAEKIKAEKQVIVIPLGKRWVRTSKGGHRCEFDCGVIIVMKGGIENIDFGFMDGVIDEWASIFLDEGGPLDDYTCMGAETIDQAEIGFVLDAMIKTPSNYIGGLRLTFWY